MKRQKMAIKRPGDDKTQLEQPKAQICENESKSVKKSENDHETVVDLINHMQRSIRQANESNFNDWWFMTGNFPIKCIKTLD